MLVYLYLSGLVVLSCSVFTGMEKKFYTQTNDSDFVRSSSITVKATFRKVHEKFEREALQYKTNAWSNCSRTARTTCADFNLLSIKRSCQIQLSDVYTHSTR